MNNSEFTWLASDATEMHGVRWSPVIEAKAVICIVHGLGEHSGRYLAMAEHLTSCNFEVVSFDLRGHGLSAGRRGHTPSFQQMLQDIDTFISGAAAIDSSKPLFVLGHSMGGTLVANYSMLHKMKFVGVIVSSALFQPAFEPPKWKLRVANLLRNFWPSLLLSNEIDDALLTRDLDMQKQRCADVLVHDRISVFMGAGLLELGQKLLDKVSDVSFPLLVMHGDADQITSHLASVEFAKRAGRQCTVRIWTGLYHELYQEPERAEVFTYLTHWMDQQLALVD